MPIIEVHSQLVPYEPTDLNVHNAQDVYRLLSLAAHEDVSYLTLRPIEYRPFGGSLYVTFGGGWWPTSLHFGGDGLGQSERQ